MDNENRNGTFMFPSDKHVTIKLGNIEYSVSTHFSLNDAELYLSYLEDNGDAKYAIAAVIYSKLEDGEQPKPTLEEICNEDDEAFTSFILAVVNDCQDLKKYYDETDRGYMPTQRFALAYKRYHKFWSEQLISSTKPLRDTYNEITKSIDLTLVSKMQNSLCACQPAFFEAEKMAQKVAATLSPALIQMAQTAQEIAPQLAPIQSAMLEYAQAFKELLANVKIPTVAEADRSRLEANHERWGKLGWTIIPNAPLKLFKRDPSSLENPNKVAMKYCSAKDMDELFSSLKSQTVNQSDLSSAIFCYQQRQYKACAQLLFGLIDSKLIRKQPRRDGENRVVGSGAVRKLKEKFRAEHNIEELFFLALDYKNLMACLETLFAFGDNFKSEPPVINRNYIDHGMNSRHVRKRDCIQLFLALHNLLSFLEYA